MYRSFDDYSGKAGAIPHVGSEGLSVDGVAGPVVVGATHGPSAISESNFPAGRCDPTSEFNLLENEDEEAGASPEKFLEEVLAGLASTPKQLPCKYLYDWRGSCLFEQICGTEAYYPTRTEQSIMGRYVEEMSGLIGPNCQLVEFGSGSSVKTRILLDNLDRCHSYVPVDISRRQLLKASRELASEYPHLDVDPVCADYTTDFFLPDFNSRTRRRVVYFPGSTIGNFQPSEAAEFMARIAHLAGQDGGVLIGVDLQKERQILELAYDDPGGVTAEFNLNLLARINRELDADFHMDHFRHSAFYNARESRMEMHLVSLDEQKVRIADREFDFLPGESIHTENSYKYSLQGFAALAAVAGLRVEHVWTDSRGLFSVQFLARA